MRLIEQGDVIYNDETKEDIFVMMISAPKIAHTSTSGQFVMLYLNNDKLLLPRPLSIAYNGQGNLTFIYHAVGEGTRHLSKLRKGDHVKILGPLGNGFTINPIKKAALVGGGIGVPPLFCLATELSRKRIDAVAFLGFKDTNILADDFENFEAKVHIATESGNEGYKGNVIDLLRQHPVDYDEIFACGPIPMLKAVVAFAKEKGIKSQISLEERMACGVGACVGCVVEIDGAYQKICCEGPVFDGEELWNE